MRPPPSSPEPPEAFPKRANGPESRWAFLGRPVSAGKNHAPNGPFRVYISGLEIAISRPRRLVSVETGSYQALGCARPSNLRYRCGSKGKLQKRATPMPRGKWPSVAAFTTRRGFLLVHVCGRLRSSFSISLFVLRLSIAWFKRSTSARLPFLTAMPKGFGSNLSPISIISYWSE
jgi:hypothetical protein